MKKIALTIFAILLIQNLTYAQQVVHQIKITDSDSTVWTGLEYGYKLGATNGLDLEIGEKDEPPAHPDFFSAYFQFNDDDYGGLINTKKDYKAWPSDYGPIEFKLVTKALWGKELTFEWGPLANEIDSAFIMDWNTESILKVNMKKESKAIATDEMVNEMMINKFTIRIWPGNSDIDVTNPKEKCFNIIAKPNPFHDRFVIDSDKYCKYSITDINGRIIMQGNIDETEIIDMGRYETGIYFISAYDVNGNMVVNKIIKY